MGNWKHKTFFLGPRSINSLKEISSKWFLADSVKINEVCLVCYKVANVRHSHMVFLEFFRCHDCVFFFSRVGNNLSK